MDTAMTALLTENAELKTAIGVLQQQVRSDRSNRSTHSSRPEAEAGNPDASKASNAPDDSDALSSAYVGFEDQFRGSPEAIRARLVEYLPLFSGATDVLDVGCGRGKFLRLLEEHGVGARGIDLNEAMVDICRDQGLHATVADVLSYLRGIPDGSLGGLFAAQVVEHLQPGYLT